MSFAGLLRTRRGQASSQQTRRLLWSSLRLTAAPDVTRATMLLRANCLAKGNSGVRAELIERLLTLLNGDVLPLIPERGSCGASGDLVPLSYIGSAVGKPWHSLGRERTSLARTASTSTMDFSECGARFNR